MFENREGKGLKEIFSAVDKLISYAKQKLCLAERNEFYVRNTVLDLLRLDRYERTGCEYCGESITSLLDALMGACAAKGLFGEEDAERVGDAVMGALCLTPQEVDEKFRTLAARSSKAATDWLYDYAVASDYVKKEKLDSNPRFNTDKGLIVTINKAKPEFRDPKKAASGNSTKGGYPACTICRENEGFFGRSKRTLRTVSLNLGGQEWFWQFSPYGYFYQHGIAVNCEHTPMHVDKGTFYRLMDFVDRFPHWFLGCNAALPRIGGSVLAHDHYQGGGETLPLHTAAPSILLKDRAYPKVSVSVLDWFGTAVRVTGTEKDAVAEVSDKIRIGWENYENRALGIIPKDGEGVHSAISPTAVKTQKGYEMTIILRNNVTTEEYPDGVFHAHPEYHVIKKESIGLIEAQGLFILPGRLVEQLGRMEQTLVSGAPLPEDLSDFSAFYAEVRAKRKSFTAAEAAAAVREQLGDICGRILNNTAVFKTQQETAEFLKGLGFTHD